jgi:endo-1,4-beta-D-glucanase Y
MGLFAYRPGTRILLVVALSIFSAAGGCRQSPWLLWNSFSTRFIDSNTGRVFDPNSDERTTSEGQAYSLFFALAANDPATFDRVLAWTQSNLAAGDLSTHLPAWLWGKDKDGQWKILDPNPASDADVWTAYTLIEAGRLWRSQADTNLGRGMLALIAKSEVANLPGFGPMLLPGPSGFQHHSGVFTINPSYVPLFLFERLAVFDPSGPWRQIALGVPRLLEQSSRHDFAMDWVEYVPGDGFYPVAGQYSGETATSVDPCGSYDAIRVYLWAGFINPADAERASILNAIAAMSAYLAHHDVPPEKVSDQGLPSEQTGPIGFSAALVPYLRAMPNSSRAAAAQIIRLSAQRNAASGLYGKDPAYYDQCLALFATGFLDARFRFGPRGELNVEWKRG